MRVTIATDEETRSKLKHLAAIQQRTMQACLAEMVARELGVYLGATVRRERREADADAELVGSSARRAG